MPILIRIVTGKGKDSAPLQAKLLKYKYFLALTGALYAIALLNCWSNLLDLDFMV